MSSIWNPQDRYILANGAVSANSPLSGDGSNSQPLGLDLKTDNSLSGNGTLTSPLGVVPGYNETVLYSSDVGTSAVTLSEPFSAFERIKLVHNSQVEELSNLTNNEATRYWHFYGTPSQGVYKIAMVNCSLSGNKITNVSAKTLMYPVTGTATAFTVSLNDTYALNTIRQVIGINRKQ